MESMCPQHPYLEKKVDNIETNTEKIVVALYGPYENPEHGLIHTVNNRMTMVENRVTTLEKTATSIKGTVVRSVWGIVSLLGAILIALITACAEGWMK